MYFKMVENFLLLHFFLTGTTEGHPFWDGIRDAFLVQPSNESIACHKPKPILLPTGEVWTIRSYSLVKLIIAPQIIFIAQQQQEVQPLLRCNVLGKIIKVWQYFLLFNRFHFDDTLHVTKAITFAFFEGRIVGIRGLGIGMESEYLRHVPWLLKQE